jgi:hypothetical protein
LGYLPGPVVRATASGETMSRETMSGETIRR